MHSKHLILFASLLVLAAAVFFFLSRPLHTESSTVPPASTPAAPSAELTQLREQVKKLEGLVPDQAAIMTKVAYHFTNLWFAADQENWPLADFYLGEVRNNVKWAVRSKPMRKGPNNEDVDLNAIATALDKGQFTDLKKAIDTKDKAHFAQLYDDTLKTCYACHKASAKPYLRPQRPTQQEVRIINMDPNAKTPE
ncbi:MAG TPA: hypothetical protein VKX17_18395 [Planctomycetota bacterium]|nr:hypothetical protein [Planctomycetota bacterium]